MKFLTAVRFVPPDGFEGEYPFEPEDRFVFMGEIVQMPGHCVVVKMDGGAVFCGYHTDNFAVLSEDEC